MWPSSGTAAWLYDLANIGLIIGLAVGVISTVLVVWMGNVKEEYLNRELADSRERTASLEKQSGESMVAIAKANADSAQSLLAAKQAEANLAGANSRAEEAKAISLEASAKIAEAHREAANANERAASLERDATQARLETERLKSQLAWRILPQNVANELGKILSVHVGQVNIKYVANDTEAQYFAIQLANIFGKSGWQVGMMSEALAGTVIFGLWVPDTQSPSTQTIRTAFVGAKIGFSTQSLPVINTSISSGSFISGAPILFVGSKPIPQ